MNFFENRNTYANGNALTMTITKHMTGVKRMKVVRHMTSIRRMSGVRHMTGGS